MVSSSKQLPACPVCHQTDQVNKLKVIYKTGESRFAPPPLPQARASMMKYLSVGMVLVGIGSFLVLVMLSTGSFSWIQMGLTLAVIVTALVLSFLAVRSLGQADEQNRRRYSTWDKAMANWNRLLYCSRDKIVFDPDTDKALSDTNARALLSLEDLETHQHQAEPAVSH